MREGDVQKEEDRSGMALVHPLLCGGVEEEWCEGDVVFCAMWGEGGEKEVYKYRMSSQPIVSHNSIFLLCG